MYTVLQTLPLHAWQVNSRETPQTIPGKYIRKICSFTLGLLRLHLIITFVVYPVIHSRHVYAQLAEFLQIFTYYKLQFYTYFLLLGSFGYFLIKVTCSFFYYVPWHARGQKAQKQTRNLVPRWNRDCLKKEKHKNKKRKRKDDDEDDIINKLTSAIQRPETHSNLFWELF